MLVDNNRVRLIILLLISESYEKISYHALDLASVTGSGDESKACLLNVYQQTNTRPANAYLEIRMKLTVIEEDHIIRRSSFFHFSNYQIISLIAFPRPDSNYPFI